MLCFPKATRKKNGTTFFIVATLIGLLFLLRYLIVGQEICISFVTEQKHTAIDYTCVGALNDFEWFIITNEDQKEALLKSGYTIPSIDFTKYYLIISNYRIAKLYRMVGRDSSSGVPKGRVLFDKDNSKDDYYYLYLMPCFWLSQCVG